MTSGKEITMSDNEVLQEIKRVSELSDVPDDPRAIDMKKYGKISVGAVTNRFDSWTKAKKLACINNVRYDLNYQELTCANCNTTERVTESAYINMYGDWLCSSKCKNSYYKKSKSCQNCGEEVERARSQIDRYNSIYCSDSCKREDERVTQSHKAKLAKWATDIKKSSNYTCEDCGDSYEVMCAHHSPPRSEMESREEELKLDNGVCLCYPCHAERHSGTEKENVILSWWEWYNS